MHQSHAELAFALVRTHNPGVLVIGANLAPVLAAQTMGLRRLRRRDHKIAGDGNGGSGSVTKGAEQFDPGFAAQRLVAQSLAGQDAGQSLGGELALCPAQSPAGSAVCEPRPASLPAAFTELYRKARAAEVGLTLEEFAEILCGVGAKYFPGGNASEAGVASSRAADADLISAQACSFYEGLRLEELALARACAKGIERAWEVFLNRYREKLYDAALAVTKEESAGRELADSLYAELFGTCQGDGPRVSKLNFYAGRGSLEGWLRTVLAQEFVNRYRTQRRLVSLDEQTETGAQFPAREPIARPEAGSAPDPRLEAAADEALQALEAEERYVLAAHYLDGSTLAEIARLLGVHESTVSRRIEKIAKALRKRIVAGLRERGMSRDQAQEALETDVRELSLDVRARLRQGQAQEKGPGIVP